jgi:alpha/beta superfamily hydrolase
MMTDPSNAVAPEVYLQAAAVANNFESFGRAIASSVLQASADPAVAIDISASAQPVAATHGAHCISVTVTINGWSHTSMVCINVE